MIKPLTSPETAPLDTALAYLPIGLFSSVMALAGLGVAWQRASAIVGAAAPQIGGALLLLAACVFAILFAAYLRKVRRHPAAVYAELAHPLTLPFFSMPTIGLILLASGIVPYAASVAEPIWYIGAFGTIAMMIIVVGGWLTMRPGIRKANPSWFVPVICNALTPVAGVPLGHATFAWIAFAAATAVGAPLFLLVCYRLVAHDRLPMPLLPTLVILIAPAALEFSGYVALTGTVDAIASQLFYTTLLMLAIVITFVPLLASVPFGPSWWSFTFPLDAAAIAALRYDAAAGSAVFHVIAVFLLTLATAIVALVGLRTVLACARGTFLKPSLQNV